MIGQSIQFKYRNAMSLLLALLMLTLAATPALAWFDEGEVNGQAARPCRLVADDQEVPTVYCHQVTPNHARPVAGQVQVRPAIARAEQGFFVDQVSTESLAQTVSDR